MLYGLGSTLAVYVAEYAQTNMKGTMINMVEMYRKSDGSKIGVYHIDADKRVALCYDQCLAAKQNGNGWTLVSLNRLVPAEYFNQQTQSFMSKTEHNKIKSMLTLVSATWRCTDGSEYDHTNLEHAIAHQKELIEKEEDK